MSTSGANTQIHAQVWNGVSWGAPTLMSTIAAVITTFRPFDLEYETSGDRAIIAYSANVNNQFSYQIWNGAAWSVAATQAIALNTAPAALDRDGAKPVAGQRRNRLDRSKLVRHWSRARRGVDRRRLEQHGRCNPGTPPFPTALRRRRLTLPTSSSPVALVHLGG